MTEENKKRASLLNWQAVVRMGREPKRVGGAKAAWPICSTVSGTWSLSSSWILVCGYRLCSSPPGFSFGQLGYLTDVGPVSGGCFTDSSSAPCLTSGQSFRCWVWRLPHPCEILPIVLFTSGSTCLGSPADSGCDQVPALLSTEWTQQSDGQVSMSLFLRGSQVAQTETQHGAFWKFVPYCSRKVLRRERDFPEFPSLCKLFILCSRMSTIGRTVRILCASPSWAMAPLSDADGPAHCEYGALCT